MKIKKKLAAVILCCLLICGCENKEYITISGSSALMDDNSHIEIDVKYTLKGFEKEEIENGCIVTIYYELKEEPDENT